ncbi:hypothetical protein [Crossiella cryophila]|uniref:WXG100 family type VII secretion target n=1 Tax=Crossiella cryophila TaxID=43355 RepID=A0A7W7C879_9PSEU|nr:hypothetical protein [Crossiella cryophila]MBB4676290.1 hypothetical protein [Crossiella cryophila]
MNGFGLNQDELRALAQRLSLATKDIEATRKSWDAGTRDGATFATTDAGKSHLAFQQHLFDTLRLRVRAFDTLTGQARDSLQGYASADDKQGLR